MMGKDLIIELNRLREPARPYLAQQVSELHSRHPGRVLETGPFSGLALELACRGIGTSFHMAEFPVEKMLTELGYNIVSRTASREALALLKEDPSRFDVVVTDQTMPEMTGVELAREVLALRADMPVVMCTGSAMPSMPTLPGGQASRALS